MHNILEEIQATQKKDALDLGSEVSFRPVSRGTTAKVLTKLSFSFFVMDFVMTVYPQTNLVQ